MWSPMFIGAFRPLSNLLSENRELIDCLLHNGLLRGFGSNGGEIGEAAEASVGARRGLKRERPIDRFRARLSTSQALKRRRYRMLRIPKSVIEKFLLARGGSVEIETPASPPKGIEKKS
jgi:hypothetical protein